MEPDTPDLNMSIGEYYKLLLENRGRVTRHKVAEVTNKNKPHPEEKKLQPAPSPKPHRATRPKKPKEAKEARETTPHKPEKLESKEKMETEPKKDTELPKKRSVPESSEEESAPAAKPTSKKVKKTKDESKPKETKTKETAVKKDSEPLKKYTQKLPDGVFREHVIGRIACLKRKLPDGSIQTIYVKFIETNDQKEESYVVEILDPDNIRKAKSPTSKDKISLKQEKVYLIIEPAWLCLGFKEQKYQPVFVLLNIGRTDIEDLQFPEQPAPADYKPQPQIDLSSPTPKQAIFSTDQKVLIMMPETQALLKCSTELLFMYNPQFDSNIRKASLSKNLASLKLFTDLDYVHELHHKLLHENEEVEITPENAKNCLFSEISFGERKGILLSFNKERNGLCIRAYSQHNKSIPPEIQWIYLTGNNATKVYANLLKGRATLLELEAFDPLATNSKYTPQYKHCEIQDDEDPKPDKDEKENEPKRCAKCNYVIDKLEFRNCGKCGDIYHKDCLSEEAQKIGIRDKKWRCQNCIRCAACLSNKNKESLTICTTCNTAYHQKCMEPDILSQMPTSSKGKTLWKCDLCSKCVSCGSKTAGSTKNSKWSLDYTLCSKCKKKKVNNQYCPVCEVIWTKTDDEPMIECACGMWVHQSCDKTLTDDVFDKFKQKGKEYLCIRCRNNKRNKFISDLINLLMDGDKMHYFENPVDLMQVPNYSNVVKNPMCFNQMKEKAAQSVYITSPETLKADFELICNNAMAYNMPKTPYYKEAQKLLDYGTVVLQSNWSKLLNFKTWALEEQEYAKQMVEKKKQQKTSTNVTTKSKEKPAPIPEDEKGENESDESGNIGLKKTLRKRKAINYSEEQGKDIIDAPSSPEMSPVVVVPSNIKKKKQPPKKPTTQGPAQPSNMPKKDQSYEAPQKGKEKSTKDEISNNPPVYFELLAQREEEDSKYLYSNPIVAQFNDPHLCFSEMCSLCGAFGNPEDFIMCILCGESYHPYCITLPAGADIAKMRKYWKCLNCKYCETCCKATGEDKLLYCDSCDKAYHTYCLVPPLKKIPECAWKCKECFKCIKCGTTSFFGENSSTTETSSDFKHTNNFSYCNKCGLEEHAKSYCSMCENQGDFPENPLVLCSVCKRSSHIKCSRLNLVEYKELTTTNADFKCFTCLMKERSSQEIHYEVCEAYLNINNISYKHSMLNDILHIVLNKYLNVLDIDHSNTILNSFVDENQALFKQDPDIIRFLQLQESQVFYEDESSDINSNAENDEQNHDNALELFERKTRKRPKNFGKELKDLIEISKSCPTKDKAKIKTNEEIISYVIDSKSDSEFENIQEIVKPQDWPADIFLANPAKTEYTIQKLKKDYQDFSNPFTTLKEQPEFKARSLLDVADICKQKLEKTSIPYILSNVVGVCGNPLVSHTKIRHIEPMRDLEESKEKSNNNGLKIKFSENEMYQAKGINDTFLPEKWSVFNSLYKPQTRPKYRQGRHFEDYMDMIDIGNEQTSDLKEQQMQIELPAILKIQQTFHKWIYNFISTKVHEVNKTLHEKANFEKSISVPQVSKKDANSVSESPSHKSPEKTPSLPELNPEPMTDINELDPIIENPSVSLTCCLCKQNGERKLSGRLIPFQGALYVHTNCALWSTEVFETNDGALLNFAFAYKRSKTTKCNYCNKPGATVSCSARKYHANYHFICAVSQQSAFLQSKTMYCKQCAKMKGLQLGYPNELNQKRRLYLLKTSQACNSSEDINKPGTLERWRPFGYESFNRVGNLTVIKLSKRLDKLLSQKQHEVGMLNPLDGYVSMRIFWNITDPQDPKNGLPFFGSKGYYLCNCSSQNSMSVKVYNKPSINILKPYIPHYFITGKSYESDPFDIKPSAEKEIREIWNEWLSNVKKHLPKFNLENISFNASELVGTTKFPISAWHLLDLKNFETILYSNQAEQSKPAAPPARRDPNAPKQNYAMFVGDLKEESFNNIIRMNDEIGFKSTKYIVYKRAQASPFMGKIGVRDAGPPVAPQNPAKLPKRFKPKELIYESKNVKTNVKDVDLPIAMKYRNYRNMPKKIEVAPSRIHKNGLFATDEYFFYFRQ